MSIFESSAPVNFPLEQVNTWFRRRGALTRITPHWAGSVIEEAAVAPGSRAKLKSGVPGTRSVITMPWVSEVTRVEETSFTDRQLKGPFKEWEHTHDLLGTAGATVVRDSIRYELLPESEIKAKAKAGEPVRASSLVSMRRFAQRFSGKQVEKHIEAMLAERTRRLEADLAFQQRYAHEPITVVIAGASGMVGRQVQALLTGGGHTVRTLVRREPRTENEFRWNPARGTIDEAAFDGAQAVIHLGGASINTRFSEKNKKRILESRVNSTHLLAQTLAKLAPQGGPQTFICASAIGYYGANRSGELLSEESKPGGDFLAFVCKRWEEVCDPAREAGIRVVNVRTGVVQSALGGALRMQLPLFLSGAGAVLGKGENVQSWISLDDIAGIYVHALFTETLEGPVNAVAPAPVTAKKLAKTVGKAVGRPVLLRAPKLAPALLLGKDGVEQLVLADQTVSCDKLQESGYEFFETDLLTAMRHELG